MGKGSLGIEYSPNRLDASLIPNSNRNVKAEGDITASKVKIERKVKIRGFYSTVTYREKLGRLVECISCENIGGMAIVGRMSSGRNMLLKEAWNEIENEMELED